MSLDRSDKYSGACSLCGHTHSVMGTVWVDDEVVLLCHEDDHSCYHAWTVYRMRKLEGVNLDGVVEPCHHPYWKQLPGGKEVCQRCGARCLPHGRDGRMNDAVDRHNEGS